MSSKVLVVTTVSRTIEAFLIPHIKDLIQRGYEVGLASNFLKEPDSNLKKNAHSIYCVSFQRNPFHWKNIRAFKDMRMIAQEYDLIHVHTPVAAFVTRLAVKNKIPVIYSAHGFHFNKQQMFLKNWLFKKAEKICAPYTSHLVVTNQEDEEAAKQLYKNCPVTHVRGVGIDCSHFSIDRFSIRRREQLRMQYGIEPGVKILTHIGEFNQNKRQIDLVRAAAEMKKTNVRFVMLLAGEGNTKKKIENEIIKYRLEKYIKCVGFVHDIPALLSITHIGLLVSAREGLPKSIMEMMAMGIPVISTDIRGNNDLIKEGKNGYLIPVNAPSQIALKAIDLINDETICRKMGEENRKNVRSHYSLPIILEKINEIYESLRVES
ncbi:glycosyltransferase family 4 protein [Jeotgalibacillus salarius]|uniref:Glycosyltransferase family 1 protein n=1 Tax=Jeotgalibacillus salarius TaxID=546023 RepID=A0A4Y8LT43_9BACL|nr:glycosyltransferase family 4 protein [Jeotgalibacillus salarius]TFE04135.1 glycosyltransferase family 1 protein [Jeotgalibacillus salarius]